MMFDSNKAASLYVHIPFCALKCQYCAFYSAPPRGEQIERFCSALVKELEIVRGFLDVRTIFFGGGTPSLLNVSQWKFILKALERLELIGVEEFTIECNPATVTMEKARLWLDYGVNRVSLGVQSFDDNLLSRLGRIHDKRMAVETYNLLRRAGFENINIDLIYGIPGQTMELWLKTLDEAFRLHSEHLSCYELTPEEDTEFYRRLNLGEYELDEDLSAHMYDELVERAEGVGLYRYEVSNFGRGKPVDEYSVPEFACRHNVNYWRGVPFVGVGPSASGFLNNVRETNVADTDLYCKLLEDGKRPVGVLDKLEPLARAGEIAGFGLRMSAGWSYSEFLQRTGFDLLECWEKEMNQLVSLGYAMRDERCFRLTSTGLRYADWAAELFLR
ncbi:MAG: radical SAM family heme chaperone HemW [Verrucomicrobiae bacterium]|nr:radical SAM family heme chaperone HemW [Verrucomicrobiae bacterium]